MNRTRTTIRQGEADVASLNNSLFGIMTLEHPLQCVDVVGVQTELEKALEHMRKIRRNAYPEGTMGWLLTSVLPGVLGPDMADLVIHYWRLTQDAETHIGAFERLDAFVMPNGFISVPTALMSTFDHMDGDDSLAKSQKDTLENVIRSISRMPEGPLSSLNCPPF